MLYPTIPAIATATPPPIHTFCHVFILTFLAYLLRLLASFTGLTIRLVRLRTALEDRTPCLGRPYLQPSHSAFRYGLESRNVSPASAPGGPSHGFPGASPRAPTLIPSAMPRTPIVGRNSVKRNHFSGPTTQTTAAPTGNPILPRKNTFGS